MYGINDEGPELKFAYSANSYLEYAEFHSWNSLWSSFFLMLMNWLCKSQLLANVTLGPCINKTYFLQKGSKD